MRPLFTSLLLFLLAAVTTPVTARADEYRSRATSTGVGIHIPLGKRGGISVSRSTETYRESGPGAGYGVGYRPYGAGFGYGAGYRAPLVGRGAFGGPVYQAGRVAFPFENPGEQFCRGCQAMHAGGSICNGRFACPVHDAWETAGSGCAIAYARQIAVQQATSAPVDDDRVREAYERGRRDAQKTNSPAPAPAKRDDSPYERGKRDAQKRSAPTPAPEPSQGGYYPTK